jgi:serine/threonine protein kinase
LSLPLFQDGILKDFDSTTQIQSNLGTQFPNDKYLPETFALLDDLLQLCPRSRVTATEALKSDYFTCLPLPSKPGSNEYVVINCSFKSFKDSHEIDAKSARVERIKMGKHLVLPNHYDVVKREKRERAEDEEDLMRKNSSTRR